MSNPIRVGLIRCDTHGMWFGPQMQSHDSVLLERAVLLPDDRPSTYSWMTRGTHYFFYSHYGAPRRMTAPRVEGFQITRLWDEHPEVAELASRVFLGIPRVCKTYDEVSDDVDLVFIADCNGDGSDHRMLAEPGLKKGIATFVDKPFADNSTNVRAIRDLAAQHNAAVMSLSILQANPAASQFALRLAELGRTDFGTITCHCMDSAALIHAICVAHHVFGTGITAVHASRSGTHTSIHLSYGDVPNRPRNGVVILCGVTQARFTEMFATAYGPKGSVHGQVFNDFDGSEGSALLLEHIRTWIQTGLAPRIAQEMELAIAVMDAIRLSEAKSSAVSVITT